MDNHTINVNPNTNTAERDTDGCLTIFYLIAGMCFSSMAFAISPIFGVITLSVFLAFLVYYFYKSNRTESVVPASPVQTSPRPTVPPFRKVPPPPQPVFSRLIPETLFRSIGKQIDDFSLFVEKLENSNAFRNYTNNLDNVKIYCDGLKLGDIDPESFAGKIKILMIVDMTRSLLASGHKLDLTTKEGFGILAMLCDFSGQKIPYSLADLYRSKMAKATEKLLRQLLTLPDPEEKFLVSKIMGNFSADYKLQYHILIYRFTSLIVKCDNFVSQQESDWLDEIMLLGKSQAPKYPPAKPVEIDMPKPEEEEKPKPEDEKPKPEDEKPPSIEEQLNDLIKNQLADIAKKIAESNNDNKTPTPKIPEKVEHSGMDSVCAIDKLNALIGLDNVKKEVSKLANLIKIQQFRKANGMRIPTPSYHCVFTGNPGTGKTTVARIVSEIYKELGILSKGHLVETDRSGLVGEYVGHTAVKTNKIIDEALDGVLFIDEAYTLFNGSKNDYGSEAIATLLKRMEDDKDRLVVILAGYSAEMQDVINSNPGLRSRFNRYIDFADYSAKELLEIFNQRARQFDYVITPEAEEAALKLFENAVADKGQGFGNGRFARNIFDKTIEQQSTRLATQTQLTPVKLSRILPEDIPA